MIFFRADVKTNLDIIPEPIRGPALLIIVFFSHGFSRIFLPTIGGNFGHVFTGLFGKKFGEII